MSLDRLIAEIQSRAEGEIAREKARIESEKARILADRDARTARIRSSADREGQATAQRERSRILAAARLQAKRLEYEVREAEARGFLDAARSELAAFTKTPEYPKLLKRLYAYAVERLGKDLRLRGRADDARALKSLSSSGFDDRPLPVLGGLVAESPDRSRRLNLTFDELLRLREDRLRGLLPS